MSVKGLLSGVAKGLRRTGAKGVLTRLSALSAILFSAAIFTGCATSGSGVALARSSMVVEPVEGAYLFVYEKGADPHGPPFAMSRASAVDGSYDLELPDGEYTIVARKHKNGLPGSPLNEGDQKSEPVTVTVKGGKAAMPVILLAQKKDDVKHFEASGQSDTSISGRITDSDGNPVRNFRVHVYTYAQMSERPKYVSAATGPDGRYIVFLPKGGTYYIAARDHFGGPPKIGDFFGRYDEGTIDPSGVMVKSGQNLDDINITVHKVW